MKAGKKPKFQLGVADAKLGSAIQEDTSLPCVCNEFTGEVRCHLVSRVVQTALLTLWAKPEESLHLLFRIVTITATLI